MRSSTALSFGSMNGVTAPERANHSQAKASATIEKMRAKPQPSARRARTSGGSGGRPSPVNGAPGVSFAIPAIAELVA